MQKNAPDFIGIGVDHAGLGIISDLLAAHPSIVDTIPARRFFNTTVSITTESLATYEATLPPVKKKRIRGECSPEYLSDPRAAERIVTAYPTTKLFVVVRNPIDRAIAVFDHAKSLHTLTAHTTCAQYLTAHPKVQTDGFYGYHLGAYFAYYTSLQLHIIVYEDFAADPLKVMQGLYAFLGVDANFVPKSLAAYAPPEDEPINPGRITRLIRFIAKTLKKARTKPVGPIVPPPYKTEHYFSPEEFALFIAAYIPDSAQLTNIMHRDMGVFWNLIPSQEMDLHT